ncbi:MAG: hydrogen gas-evolving membrane-bound hydrogenase subunit E [Gammaproteobacteria bacterium]|nr:hydrogen gas-evolving membrane-bound hydrogenase subunit E [Gammaproteobacteria bacterium]
MTLLQWLFDGLLGVTLIWLAWQTLASADLFKAIVLFIAFGLLMALAWVRLNAPDIALAEAAIGAGLTGALLLVALARLNAVAAKTDNTESNRNAKQRFAPEDSVRTTAAVNQGFSNKQNLFRYSLVLMLSAVAAGLAYAVLSLPPEAPGLSRNVAENLYLSGVSNPVTAVLLNFRGYDTLLEMAVLLLALLGVWSLRRLPEQYDSSPGPVLDMLSRLLVPLLLLVAGYLLWVGARAPGGAFQAGSVLAAAGVLLLLAGWRLTARFLGWPLRFALIIGLAVFVSVALIMMLSGGQLLQLPPAFAGALILLIETAATLSIGVTLAALFYGSRPQPEQISARQTDSGGENE